ncbi:kinase [Micromonospora sp. B11E3]|uniref:kinase n=1 Tax=Micromonospora sp. B11E3 TaxID=3153562 RepID=UPI00325C5228
MTTALHQLDSRYRQFQRLKAGPGRTVGYRMATEDEVAGLHASGLVVWENRRYGAVYVVDAPGLRQQLEQAVPVVHLGQLDAIDAVQRAFPDVRWTVVALICPRDVAVQRIIQRQTGDTLERLRAWDETEPAATAEITIDTSRTAPAEAASLIDQAVRHGKTATV